MVDMFKMMVKTEWKMTFTKEKAIKRYKRLIELFYQNPTLQMSMVCDACANVMHDKYKMSWEQIEEVEISVYC